ncbi:MAG TPA: 2-phosphosulfolactate phosphatase [Verrucomicrobiae bacterium]|nr:2-phosphosulfolactate phosphatase [Verrucomicrobiae bacterium]
MASTIEVLFSPAEYQARRQGGFANSVCVVFDVLRATSVMVTGLANGAAGFVPVEEIAEAIQLKSKYPQALLAGERNGLRITAALSGGVEFDLGNSPREYHADQVRGRTIISTTTNGTRALRACASASRVAIASFLNLNATAEWLRHLSPERISLICAGTGERAAWEDVACAGALADALPKGVLEDSAAIARSAYRESKEDLLKAVALAQNARRLLAHPDLRADVAYCVRRDVYDFAAGFGDDGLIKKM